MASDASLFSNAEIISELKDHLNLNTIKQRVTSLFVTLARGCSYLDPFIPSPEFYGQFLRWANNPCDLGYFYTMRSLPYLEPGLTVDWVPEYHDLCKVKNEDEALNILRLTSALPFIYRTGSTAKDEMLADGGLIDNWPIAPLLHTDVDYIIVVGLDPKVRKVSLVSHGNDRYMTSLIPGMDSKIVTSMRRDIVDGREYKALFPGWNDFKSERVITITPLQPLATLNYPVFRFFSGTLNFRLKNRKKWLNMGYNDTIKFKNFKIGGDT